jgi:hypothetical protein
MAHIGAVVGGAGVNLAGVRVHDYGVDGTMRPVILRGHRRVESGFGLDFQAKATTKWWHEKEEVVYDLESKTYNDLVSRAPDLVRCLLILLCLPQNQAEWLHAAEHHTLLRNCCYWTFLDGNPTGNENSTVRVRIPRSQVLSPDAVGAILTAERARNLGGA